MENFLKEHWATGREAGSEKLWEDGLEWIFHPSFLLSLLLSLSLSISDRITCARTDCLVHCWGLSRPWPQPQFSAPLSPPTEITGHVCLQAVAAPRQAVELRIQQRFILQSSVSPFLSHCWLLNHFLFSRASSFMPSFSLTCAFFFSCYACPAVWFFSIDLPQILRFTALSSFLLALYLLISAPHYSSQHPTPVIHGHTFLQPCVSYFITAATLHKHYSHADTRALPIRRAL